MNGLLFRALCVRLILQQWKALLFAALSVALGLALALAIRLGTESASLNLKKNLETLQQPHWIGPVKVHSEAALVALEPFFARFEYRTSRLVDAFWVEPSGESGGVESSVPVTLAVLWSGSFAEKFESSAGEPIVYVPKGCVRKHGSVAQMRAFSRQFSVQVVPYSNLMKGAVPDAEENSCAVAFAIGVQWRGLPRGAAGDLGAAGGGGVASSKGEGPGQEGPQHTHENLQKGVREFNSGATSGASANAREAGRVGGASESGASGSGTSGSGASGSGASGSGASGSGASGSGASGSGASGSGASGSGASGSGASGSGASESGASGSGASESGASGSGASGSGASGSGASGSGARSPLESYFAGTDPLRADSISFYAESPEEQKRVESSLQKLSAQVPGLQFEPQSAQLQSLGQLTQSFNINLQLMGFIAIFIGVFMVHHVFSLLVAKNAQMIAIVHAQGISLRKQIFPLFCVALFLGAIASFMGIALGVGLGRVLSIVTQSTVQALYSRLLDSNAFYWNPRELAYAFVLGLGASLVGAANPLLQMRKMDTAQVLKSGVWESAHKTFSWRTTLMILASSGAAIAVMVVFPVLVGRLPVGAFVSCLLILFLNALFAKDLTLFLYRQAGKASLSKRFLMQLRIFMPPQTGVVLQVLCLGFALTISVKSMAESFRGTLTEWVQTTLKADVWVRSTDGSSTPLPADVVLAVDQFRNQKNAPKVAAIDALRVLPATYKNKNANFRVVFNGVRMNEHAAVEPLKFLDTSLAQREMSLEIFEKSKTCEGTRTDPCPSYVSEALSIHDPLLLKSNNHIFELEASGRRIVFQAKAVVQDFGSDSGIVMSDISLVKRLFGENPLPSFMNIYLENKSDQNTKFFVDKIEQELVQDRGFALNVFTLSQLRLKVMDAFENTFRITDALYVLCAAIAFISVYTCLNLQLLQRRREWNVLWALGLGEKRLRNGMALWAGNMALAACFASLLGGLSIAAILVYIVNYYAFGYSLNLSLPWSFLGGVLILAWASGLASGWFVARGLEKHLSSHLLQLE